MGNAMPIDPTHSRCWYDLYDDWAPLCDPMLKEVKTSPNDREVTCKDCQTVMDEA